MAPLRDLMGRAARRLLSEKAPVFLRGASTNPAASAAGSALQAAAAAAAAQPAEEAELKKLDALPKRGSRPRYPRRRSRMRKKTDGLKAAPWFLGAFLALAFLEGYDMGKGDDQKPRE